MKYQLQIKRLKELATRLFDEESNLLHQVDNRQWPLGSLNLRELARIRIDREVVRHAIATYEALESPTYGERALWFASHERRNHHIIMRDKFDECSCGATFHRAHEAVHE